MLRHAVKQPLTKHKSVFLGKFERLACNLFERQSADRQEMLLEWGERSLRRLGEHPSGESLVEFGGGAGGEGFGDVRRG